MKNPTITTLKNVTLGILTLLPLINACNNGQKPVKKNQQDLEIPLSKTCYTAVDQKDTAYLSVETFNKGRITGHLAIRYSQKPKNEGTFKGSFSGDTLFVDYTFSTGQKAQPIYKNPLAFLRKDGNLILGPAIVRTYMGRSYLDKKDPINFEKGKFVFKPTTCKD
jgi:hypothetical protein